MRFARFIIPRRMLQSNRKFQCLVLRMCKSPGHAKLYTRYQADTWWVLSSSVRIVLKPSSLFPPRHAQNSNGSYLSTSRDATNDQDDLWIPGKEHKRSAKPAQRIFLCRCMKLTGYWMKSHKWNQRRDQLRGTARTKIGIPEVELGSHSHQPRCVMWQFFIQGLGLSVKVTKGMMNLQWI